jgi:hypothetical protein
MELETERLVDQQLHPALALIARRRLLPGSEPVF